MVFAYLDQQFDALSSVAGIPADQARFVVGLVSVLPLGWMFNFVKGAWLRHFIGIVFGLFLEFMVYNWGITSMLVQTVITYLLAKYVKNCGKIIMIQTILFVSAHHIYRQIYDYGGWTLDITTILMMAVCKFTSFGYCIQDGRTDEKLLTEDQKKRKIDKMPHFLEFFSYIHFFGSSIVGPAFDFYDFRLFINQQNEMKSIPIIGVIKESISQLLYGFLFMGGTVLVASKFELMYITTEEYGSYNWFWKFFYFNVVVTTYRFKYYGGWCLAQAGLASTGLTYSGKDKNDQDSFVRVESCHPFKVESTHEIRTKVQYWNMSVQAWLQRYVYFRLYTKEQLAKNKSLATKAQYMTLMVSAFWHGFYPGYYTSFMQWGMMITINKMTWKWATNYPKNFDKLRKTISYPVYWALRFIFFNGLFNYFGCGFQLLSLEANWNFYSNLNFIPNFATIGLTAFLLITNIGQRAPKVQETPKDAKKTN